MNNPYEAAFNWRHLVDLNEIEAESVEIKETPVDIVNIKPEDPIYYPSNSIKDETVTIIEDDEDFDDMKQEEPILDALNAIGKESIKFKEEHIDGFVYTKHEEHFTLPLADVFCPSTGDFRPLTVDLDEGIHSKDWDPIALIRPQNGSSILPDCTICKSLPLNGYAMDKHMRLMHPERYSMLLKKCAFCHEIHAMGPEMASHIRSMHPEESEMIIQRISANSTGPPKRCGRGPSDDELIAYNNLPFSVAEIADMSVPDFKKLLKYGTFTEPQRKLIRKIRTRRYNKAWKLRRRKENVGGNDNGMTNNQNEQYDSDWLKHFENMDDNKDHQFDDMAVIKQEDLISCRSEDDNDEMMDMKDDFGDFTNIEPIIDVFCPSTGDSRPLNIHLDEEMLSKRQIDAPDRPRLVQAGASADHTICELVDTHENVINNQLQSVHPEWFRKCNFCDSAYNLGPDMETHVRMVHSDTSPVLKKQSVKFLKCDFCDSSYKNGSAMGNHKRAMHPQEWDKAMQKMQLVKCDLCDGYYKMGNGMETHVRSKHTHPFERKSTICDFCDSSYRMGAVMDNHVRSMHPEEWDKIMQKMDLMKCDLCDGYYKIGNGMENHVQSKHSPPIESQFVKCDFCDGYYKIGNGLENHVRLKHTRPIESQKCDFCDCFYNIGAGMASHVRKMHPVEWYNGRVLPLGFFLPADE